MSITLPALVTTAILIAAVLPTGLAEHADGRGQRPAAASTPGTALILGQVVDAGTGRGIPNVLVTIGRAAASPAPIGELTEARPPVAPVNPGPGGQRALSATDGRFVFRDLSAGGYSLFASAPGYVAGAFGQLRPQGPIQSLDLRDAEKRGGVEIRLWRTGVITGTVRDEFGEPAVGATVECWRRVVTGGSRRYASVGTTPAADDRGMYRLANLIPGDYICGIAQNPRTVPASVVTALAATEPTTGRGGGTPEARRLANSGGSSSGSGVRMGGFIYISGAGTLSGAAPPPPDANGRLMTYPPLYYPASTTTANATVIAVKPGEERSGIDLQLRLVPAVRVSGKLIGPDGPGAFLGVRLVPADGNDLVSEGQAEYAHATSDAVGDFTFLGIAAGDYILKSRLFPRPVPGGDVLAALNETSLWTATPVTVGRTDMEGLAITIREGIRVSGRVEFAGSSQPDATVQQRVGVRLQSAEGRTSSPIPLDGRVQADGTFRTAGYPAGRYIVNVLNNTVPAGWSVRSIVTNGRDVSVDPLELVDDDIANVVVTFTDRVTTISGTATGANGPDAGAEVVVFPADSTAWKTIGVVSRRSRVERVASDGTFTLSGLPPGQYYVAAIAGATPGDRQDPAFLSAVVGVAERVTLADGGVISVRLAVKR